MRGLKLGSKIGSSKNLRALYPLSAALIATLIAYDPVKSQDNDPVAGLALARHVCADCHLVAGDDPKSLQRGPAFTELAGRADVSAASLRAFLEKPHGEMPDIPLTTDDINDLVAYILVIGD